MTPPDCTHCSVDPSLAVLKIDKISAIEVINTINSLNNQKSKDVYWFDTNFLKQFKDSLVLPVTYLVTLSFEQSVVPSAWKLALVIPIFKSGDKTEMLNYRPISILSVISKIAEKWVVQQLNNHWNNNYTSLHAIWFSKSSLNSPQIVFLWKKKSNTFLIKNKMLVWALFLPELFSRDPPRQHFGAYFSYIYIYFF